MTDNAQEKTDRQKAWEATPNMVVMTIADRAMAFYSEGRLDRAQDLLQKLVKMRPESSSYWALLGVIHRRKNRIVTALQCLQKAAELDPSNQSALVNLGESLIMVGKLEEGVEVLGAVFNMSVDSDKPVEEQDMMTKRAGAQLAIIEKVCEAAQAGELEEVRS